VVERGVGVLVEMREWFEELACRAGLDGLPSIGRVLKPLAIVLCAGAVAWALLGQSATGGGASAPSAVAVPSNGTSDTAAPTHAATVTVHVVGEVRRPGVYDLPGGARAKDAVDAAGGLLGDADQAAVNLARVVSDGEQIAVPRQGAAVVGAGSAAAAGGSSPTAKVDLNTATAEQLDALPGVGPATAAKIIADRAANGPFRTVDDLMRVSGIGPAKFDALKDLVRVQ
jgi:competence protein ComEA